MYRTIRGDEKGLFVWVNHERYRPGQVGDHADGSRSDAGPLIVGDVLTVVPTGPNTVRLLGWEDSKPMTLYWFKEKL